MVFDWDLVGRIQAPIFSFDPLNCNFSSQLIYDENLTHLLKQSYNLEQFQKIMSMNVDKKTTVVALFGTFGLSWKNCWLSKTK